MKHLLIDFENIQPQNLDKLPEKETHIWLFLGVTQKMLPIDLVESLLRFGDSAHLIRLQKTGKNALDFYLSYYLGQITATDPQATIGILSRDGGYDILVEHILDNQHAQGIVRLATLEEVQLQEIEPEIVPILPKQPEIIAEEPKPTISIAPYFQAALTALRQPDAFRPSRLHNLQLNLRNHILRDLLTDKSHEECEKIVQVIINKLKNQNLISVDENEFVQYHISNEDILLKIQRYILKIKPNTYIDFQAAVQNRADALGLTVTVSDIQSFARHLCEQNHIRQNNGKIEYAPFPTTPAPTTQPEKRSYQPDETMWKKVVAAVFVAKEKRPSKLNALCNVIKSHAKCSDTEVQKLLQHLQDKKLLQINDTKIIYQK